MIIKRVAALAACAILTALVCAAVFGPTARAFSPKVLMYHLVSDEAGGDYEEGFVRPADFEAQLAYLSEKGRRFIFADEYRLFDSNAVAITFDDGYRDNFTEALPLLEKYGAVATVFLATDLVGREGYLSADDVAAMAASGRVRFASHTASHADLSRAARETARDEYARSLAELERLAGSAAARVISYPGGTASRKARAEARAFFTRGFIATQSDGFFIGRFTTPRIPVTRDMTLEEFERRA